MDRRIYPEWAVIGERLGLVEKALGLSGNRIASELGLNRQTWSRYRLGQRELPIALAGEMRKRWGCALDWLYLGEEQHNREDFRLLLSETRRKAAQGRGGGSLSPGTRNRAAGPSRA
jgi:transcriptional regulator with XRE-family HTH domain